MTPEMQQRAAARAKVLSGEPGTYEDRSLSERCIVRPWSGPPITPGNYNNNLQIFQAADYVVLHVEQSHDSRIVPLDGRPHIDKKIRQILGDSIGHWEGDTLVVETTNFTDQLGKTAFRGSGGNMHLTERFTRTAPDLILYRVTVEDPTVFTTPWTFEMTLTLRDNKANQIFEAACHAGNYAMTNVLSGARVSDRRRR